jgi:hypothetical protein
VQREEQRTAPSGSLQAMMTLLVPVTGGTRALQCQGGWVGVELQQISNTKLLHTTLRNTSMPPGATSAPCRVLQQKLNAA